MHLRLLGFLLALFYFACFADAAPAPRFTPKPRPAAGIGILTLKKPHAESQETIILYEEPGLIRTAAIDPLFAAPFEHIFGSHSSVRHLIVTARKQEWLKVIYDDAGREGWLKTNFGADFKPYADWLRQPLTQILPGLQKKYYELHRTADGTHIGNLPPKQNFKILAIRNSWAQILTEQNQFGWLQWKDDDGRLLIGIAPANKGTAP